MKKNWKFKFDGILSLEMDSSGMHPMIAFLLETRGFLGVKEREKFLKPVFDRDIHNPFLFSQMEKVVAKFIQVKEKKETVGIFGDYDADGVTSSVIMCTVLMELGFDTKIYIPHKVSEGHGLHLNAIEEFALNGVKLLVTLDCGMMNHQEIEEANKRGMEVIIIDHHHIPEILPKAYAIINPKLQNETYPFKELCGAGATFKVAQALYARLNPKKQEQLKWILDVVATGTVADVMPLIGENRVFVKYGLIVLSKTKRVGFREMFAVSGMKINENKIPNARDIGFMIAPRINAASRMTHARIAFNLLMENDQIKARELALELEAQNRERQKMTVDVAEMVKKIALENFSDKKFIFAVGEHFPLGIAGLIAGKIANEFNKPTAVLCKGEVTSIGSFRSVPGFDLAEALAKCGYLLVKYGGHEQAAGMTIENDKLDKFYAKFNELAEDALVDVATEPEIVIDMRILPVHLTMDFLNELEMFAPFGEGNREPVFCLENMRVLNVRFVGNGDKHLKLSLRALNGDGKTFDAIGFSFGEKFPDLKMGDTIDIAFHLEENIWNSRRSIQLKMVDIRMSEC